MELGRGVALSVSFSSRKNAAGGTAVALSQICSTGVHPPGKDRENLNQRGPGFLGWSGMIADMFNPGRACSIGLSRRAPRRIGEPGGSQCT